MSNQDEWTIRPLGEIISVGSGDAGEYRSGDYSQPIAVYGANGPIGSHGKANFGPGYILGRVGATGEVARVEGRVWASDNTITVEPIRARCDFSFLGHLLNTIDFSKITTQSAQPLLTQTKLKQVSVTVPLLYEQRRIADVLDTVDAAIRETDDVIAKQEQVKTGLLQDLLTRGLDANGRLRDPEANPGAFQETEAGLIPRKWKLMPLKEVGDIVTGTTPSSKENGMWGDYLPFVTPGDIGQGDELDRIERWLSRNGVDHVRPVPAQSTLVVCVGSTIGKTAFSTAKLATNQQINSVSPYEEFDPRYVYAAVKGNVDSLRAEAGLQAVPLVNKTRFSEMVVPVPPKKEQMRIGDLIDQHSRRVEEEKEYQRKLQRLKTGLMQDLLTGQVRVPEAEKRIQQVTR